MVDLDAIKTRLADITEGDWEHQVQWDENGKPTSEVHSGNELVACCGSFLDGVFIADAPADLAALIAEVEALQEIRRRAADLAYELASVTLPPDAERLLSLLDDALEQAASKGLAIKCQSSEIGQDDWRFPLIQRLETWAQSSWEITAEPLSPVRLGPWQKVTDGTYERRGDGGTIMIYTAPVNANEDAIREGLAEADNRARQWGWTLEGGDE